MYVDMKTKPDCLVRAGLLAGGLLFALTSLAGSGVEQNLEKKFPVGPGGKLVIEADRGAIDVATGASDKVQVRVLREAKGATKTQADALFANHEVTFNQEGKTVTVTAREKKKRTTFWGRQPWLEVRYEVSIPKAFDVKLTTAGGNIQVGELEGSAFAHTTSGSIDLPRVTGRVEAQDAGGNITVGEAGADLTAHTTSGSITAKRVKGRVDASDAGGDIQVNEAGGDVVAGTTSGSITLGAIKGKVTATDAGGNIKIESAEGDIEARTTSGSVEVKLAKGKSVRVKNAGGNISIGEADGDVRAHTTSGTIQVHAAQGRVDAEDAGGNIEIGDAGEVSAQTTSGAVRVHKARGKLDVKDAGGDINIGETGGEAVVRTTSGSVAVGVAVGKLTVHNAGGDIKVKDARDIVTAETSSGSIEVLFSSPLRGECRLAALGGGVRVALPKSAAIDLDAKASGGTVLCDLPVTMTVRGAPKPGVLGGKLNGGGPALVLRASSGDIHLKESPTARLQVEDEVPGK